MSGLKSGMAILTIEGGLTASIAGRVAMIMDLLDTRVFDEEGNVIGTREPLITREQGIELLAGLTECDLTIKP